MDSTVLAILVSVVLSAVFVFGGVVGQRRKNIPRPLIIGIGLALIPVGLCVMGVMNLLLNGIKSLVSWVSRTPLDTKMWVGIALVALGLISCMVGGLLNSTPKPDDSQPKQSSRSNNELTFDAAAGKLNKSQGQTGNSTADDFDEIEAILKSRGIE